MNQPISPIALSKLTQSAPKFFVMYNDFQSGLRARHFAESLGSELGNEGGSKLALWRSEMLELEDLASLAESESRDVDYLILSLAGNATLSSTIKHWIERQLENTAGRLAGLILLIDPARGVWRHAHSIRCYLRQVTEAAGVAFFAHCQLAPAETLARVYSRNQPCVRVAYTERSAKARASSLPVLGQAA